MDTPMPELALMLAELEPHARAHVLRVLERFPRVHLTSGRRSPERNRAVGGVPGSYHVRGRAADFGGSSDDLARVAQFIVRDRVGRGCTGPEECWVEGRGPQRVGGSSTGPHVHAAW